MTVVCWFLKGLRIIPQTHTRYFWSTIQLSSLQWRSRSTGTKYSYIRNLFHKNKRKTSNSSGRPQQIRHAALCFLHSGTGTATDNSSVCRLAQTYDKQAKLSRYRRAGDKRERTYSFCAFLTSALDGSKWSASRPGRALPPGKGPPVPTGKEAGWAPELVRTHRLEEKSSESPGDRTLVARSVVTTLYWLR
jgi:hypothetical protein